MWGGYSVGLSALVREVGDYIILCARMCGVTAPKFGPLYGNRLNAEAQGLAAWQESLELARRG